MSERMNNYDAAEFAENMRKKVESGEASSYNEADKLQEKENYIGNLQKAKECLGLNRHLANFAFYIKKAGETEMVSRFYNEVLPKIGIGRVERCLALLGDNGMPEEANLDEFESIFGHEIRKMSLYDGLKPETPFYFLISKLTAELSVLFEDYRSMGCLKFIGDEEKFKELERLAEEYKENYPNKNSEYWDKWQSRVRSIERIEKYRLLFKTFLQDVENMNENKTNPDKVLSEIEEEIENKLEQVK